MTSSAFLSYERVWLGLLHDVDGKTLKNLTRQATRSNPHVPAYLLGVPEPSGREDGNITVGGEDEAEAYASIALKWWLAAAPRTLDWLVDNVRLPKAGRRSSQTRRTQEEPSPGPSRRTKH